MLSTVKNAKHRFKNTAYSSGLLCKFCHILETKFRPNFGVLCFFPVRLFNKQCIKRTDDAQRKQLKPREKNKGNMMICIPCEIKFTFKVPDLLPGRNFSNCSCHRFNMALTSMCLYPMIYNNLKRIPNEEKIAKSAINVINHKFASADKTI